MHRTDGRITAADVTSGGLPRAPWGRRGYDEYATDALLAATMGELELLTAENADKAAEIARLKRRFIARDGALPDAGPEEAYEMARSIVSEAQATADGYVRDSRDYAARLAHDAERQLEEAGEAAGRILADATGQARRAAAAAMEQPVPAEPGGPLRAARAQAAWSGTFAAVYLGNLIALREAELRILRDWAAREQPGGQGG